MGSETNRHISALFCVADIPYTTNLAYGDGRKTYYEDEGVLRRVAAAVNGRGQSLSILFILPFHPLRARTNRPP